MWAPFSRTMPLLSSLPLPLSHYRCRCNVIACYCCFLGMLLLLPLLPRYVVAASSPLFSSSSTFFFLHCFLFFRLPPLFLRHPFLFTISFFLIETPVCTGVPCVGTLVQIVMYRSDRLSTWVWYPKRQSLVKSTLILYILIHCIQWLCNCYS